jgi:hypothetical protein
METDVSLVGRARDALANGNVFGALCALDEFLRCQPLLTADDVLRQAEEIDRTAYRSRVSELVDEIGEEWRSGSFDGSRSAFERRIDEALEGQMTDWREARQCLFFSSNSSAGHHHLGADTLDWDGGVPWCELAYYALLEDVRDGLQHEGLFDRDPPRPGARPCSYCGNWIPISELTEGECIGCRPAA